MKKFVFNVVTIKDENTQKAQRVVEARSEFEARQTLVRYYLAKSAQVKSITLVGIAA